MKSAEATGVVQVGATGVVAEMFRAQIARPDTPFRLEAIATANHPELRNKKFGETGLEGPPQLDEVPIITVVDAIENTDAPLIFSGMQTKMAARYEHRLAAGRLVVTNASANRVLPEVPVVSAFTNADHIDELYGRDDSGRGRIIAGGNCGSAILSVPLAPINDTIGIESIAMKTLQGWSGAGKKRIPEGTGDSDIPIEGDEASKLEQEPNEFLGNAIDWPAGILIGAEPRRAPWLRGHYIRMAVNLTRGTTKQEIEELWRSFEAPEVLNDVKSDVRSISLAAGDKWPKRHQPIRPVKLEHGPLLRPGIKPRRLDRLYPMRAQARIMEFDTEDPTRVVIEVAGDNLIQGAVGGNLLNAIYARAQGYLE
jgi:aspartate-semialdehyde dehydrogenase